MMWRRTGWCVLGSACIALSAHVAQAITVDGKLDVGPGATLARRSTWGWVKAVYR